MENCIFCKIASHEIPTNAEWENEDAIAFHDIHPKAPVHILIIPKKHIEKPWELSSAELSIMLNAAKEISRKLDVQETGFRLLFNVGVHAGQEINHVHLHLIGGAPSTAMY